MEQKKVLKVSLRTIGVIVLVIILLVAIIIGGVFLYLKGPSVMGKEKKAVKAATVEYLTKKFGDHNFKVTRIEYDYHMETLFDHSNPIGYLVNITWDNGKKSSVAIDGLYPNELKFNSSLFLEDVYYPNDDIVEQSRNYYNTKPNENLDKVLSEKLKKELDPNCTYAKINNYMLEFPDDMGRIPSLEEVKNDLKYFTINNITFSLSKVTMNADIYKEIVNEYLKKTFGGEWNVYISSDGKTINCFGDFFNASLIKN